MRRNVPKPIKPSQRLTRPTPPVDPKQSAPPVYMRPGWAGAGLVEALGLRKRKVQ